MGTALLSYPEDQTDYEIYDVDFCQSFEIDPDLRLSDLAFT
jgi:hypothetical protein